jgi:hypothetical protein
MLIRWLAVASGIFAMVVACGSDDSSDGGTGGSAGAAGSATGGTGGSAGSATGGTGGITTGGTGGGSAGQSGDSATCADYGQVPACQTCLTNHCCTETGNCKADPDCDGFVTCARACPDPTDTTSTCVQTCATTWNAPNANYNSLIVCMGTNCGTDCGYL